MDRKHMNRASDEHVEDLGNCSDEVSLRVAVFSYGL